MNEVKTISNLKIEYSVFLNPIRGENSIWINYESKKKEIDFYKELKLEGYEIYQFVQEEFKYNMGELELANNAIKFESLKRVQKTWFGLSSKIVSDLLIYPTNHFFYPYQYGHYFYLYTKNKVNRKKFEEWINAEFPKRFADLDATYAGINKQKINLMSKEDYILVTNHDYQRKFGITGNNEIINQLHGRLRKMNLISYKERKFK